VQSTVADRSYTTAQYQDVAVRCRTEDVAVISGAALLPETRCRSLPKYPEQRSGLCASIIHLFE